RVRLAVPGEVVAVQRVVGGRGRLRDRPGDVRVVGQPPERRDRDHAHLPGRVVGEAGMDATATVGGAVSDDVSTVYRLYQRGEELLAAGRSKPAAELLEEAVERAPGNASLYEPLGRALFALSRISDARRAFEQALDVDPTNAFAHFGVGRCCERQGRLTEA